MVILFLTVPNFGGYYKVIETETNKQTQLITANQKKIKFSIWVIGGLTLILGLLEVIKLWT